MPHQRMFGGEDNGQWFMRNEDGGLSATDGGLLSKFHIHSDGEMDVMLSLVEVSWTVCLIRRSRLNMFA